MFKITVNTSGQGLYDITMRVAEEVRLTGAGEAVLTLFVQHTSASLLIQENADPTATRDLMTFFSAIAPESSSYSHAAEGPDDMPAHLKAALTATSIAIPVSGGALTLGSWQGVFLFEHRHAAQQRRIVGALTPAI